MVRNGYLSGVGLQREEYVVNEEAYVCRAPSDTLQRPVEGDSRRCRHRTRSNATDDSEPAEFQGVHQATDEPSSSKTMKFVKDDYTRTSKVIKLYMHLHAF